MSCIVEHCLDEGVFTDSEEHCPGSDDERHHCAYCGYLEWEEKAYYCSGCSIHLCQTCWQDKLTFPDEYEEEAYCEKCLPDFIK